MLRRALALLGPLTGAAARACQRTHRARHGTGQHRRREGGRGLVPRGDRARPHASAPSAAPPWAMRSTTSRCCWATRGATRNRATRRARRWQILRATLPPTHPDLMSMEQTYAMTLLNMKDPKDAEPIQREIIKAQHRGARPGAPRHAGRAGAAGGDPDRPEPLPRGAGGAAPGGDGPRARAGPGQPLHRRCLERLRHRRLLRHRSRGRARRRPEGGADSARARSRLRTTTRR